jgi:Flp pilus assembly protein TadG
MRKGGDRMSRDQHQREDLAPSPGTEAGGDGAVRSWKSGPRRLLAAAARRSKSERGVALVEFAFVAPILFLVLLGMLDFGRAMNNWNDVTQLANEGARLAAVNMNPSSPISTGASNYGLPTPTTAVTCTGAKSIGDSVTVQVTIPYTWYVGKFIPLLPPTLKSTATMRLEQRPTAFAC